MMELARRLQDSVASYALFPAPWDDYISRQAPTTIRDVLYWCEYVALSNQTLASALRKLVAYFVTEIQVGEVSYEEEKKIKSYLYDVLQIENTLNAIGLDYLVYGNVFVSFSPGVERSVICPSCAYGVRFEQYARNTEANFRFKNYQFVFRCIRCGYDGVFKVNVTDSKDPTRFSVIRWNPHFIDIDYDFISGQKDIIYRIPPRYRAKVEQGTSIVVLANIPESMLQCLRQNIDYRFLPDHILHLYEPALSGLQMEGWGLPPILANFKQTWFVESLRRANHALAQDFIMPLRLITPEPRQAPSEFGDPLLNSQFSQIARNFAGIIDSWRKDPASWYFCPYPVRYQVYGAEGGRVMPAPIIDQANVDLINGLGMPVDFFRGTLTMQIGPFALRIFEGTWTSLSRVLNTFLRHLAQEICNLFHLDKCELKLARPSHVDDVNQKLAAMQLAMNNIVSMTTGLKTLGIDWQQEVKKRMEEEFVMAEEARKLQERVQQSALTQQLSMPAAEASPMGGDMSALLGMLGGGGGGGMPVGGEAAPAGGAPSGDPLEALLAQLPQSNTQAISLDQLSQICQQIAQQLYSLHPSMRRSMLYKIRLKNEIAAMLISQYISQLDQQAALQGKVQAQQGGGGMMI